MKRIILILFLLIFSGSFIFSQETKDALVLYRQGSFEEAIQVCLQEIEAMPKRLDSYVVMCWSLLKLNRYQESLEKATLAYGISPTDHRVQEILGETFFYLGKYEQALRYFEEYTVIAPTGDRIDTVYYLMGEIFIQLGEFNHADIALTTAVYHSPNIARWWARLGYAREMAEDFRWAVDAYNQALKLNPGFIDAQRGKERAESRLAGG
ncbi:MAG: tetratricopeptide repeat protein [Spirochaetales bacterium]|nr:MAG: tetratricopeptide repeat protein [Spirochaetales bacterium]